MTISVYDDGFFSKIREILLSGLSYLLTIFLYFAYLEEQHALYRKINLCLELVKGKLVISAL